MILFKDLKQGQIVHVLDRKTADYMTGKVEETPSLPHYDNRQPAMSVDVKINIKGDSRIYAIPENLSVTYAGDLCIATEQTDLVQVVDDIEKKADEAIADYPRQKEVKEKCKHLALELNPTKKAQIENEERLNRIEQQQDKMFNMLEMFMQNHKSSTSM